MDPYLLLGIAGMCMILVGFVLVNMHRMSADSLVYDALNCIGSTLLLISAIPDRAWPFIILNAVWALWALKDILFEDLWKTPHRVLRKS